MHDRHDVTALRELEREQISCGIGRRYLVWRPPAQDLATVGVEAHVLIAELDNVGLLGVELEWDDACGAGGLGLCNELQARAALHPTCDAHEEVLGPLNGNSALG